MIRVDVVQGTPEWQQARLGIPTASNFDKIVTTKGEPSKSAEKYMYQLVGERLSGTKEDGYTNSHMERGIQLEGEARQFYDLVNGVEVEEVGFCKHDSQLFGCSPDGLVGEDGGIEIKCPSMAVQVEYLLKKELPTAYFQQVQGTLLVTGRKWWDFVSYYPSLQPLILRVQRDEGFIGNLERQLKLFSERLEKTYTQLKEEK